MKLHLKYCIFFLILLVVSCTKKRTTTSSRNDSVEKYLKLASIDTLPTETRKKYNHKAFSFIDLEKNDSTVRWYLCETALNSMNFKDSVDYLEKSKLHFEKSEESNDTLNLARFYRYKGAYYRTVPKKFDSAFYCYKKAEKLYQKTEDLNGLAITILSKGTVFHIINDYSSAELEILRAKNILIKVKNLKSLIYVYNSLGNVYKANFNFNEALIQYNKGFDIIVLNKLDLKSEKALILNNIGNLYFQRKDFEKAISYYKKSLEIENLQNIEAEIFLANYFSIFSCKIQLNELEGLDEEFEKLLFLIKKYNPSEEFFLLIEYSKLCYLKGKIKEAQKYADLALILARKIKAPPYDVMNSLLHVGKVNKDKASQAFVQYDILADSLLNRERRERSRFLKIQLETDEIAQEKEKEIKLKWVQTSIIASVLIIVILLFIIYKQQNQKKEFLLIQNQQKANEEIYQLMLQQKQKEEEAKQQEKKRIALELHDNVMNRLASTRFNLFTLTQQTNTENTNYAKQHIQTIKEIEDEIRSLTHELSKEETTNENRFASVLTDFISQQNQIHLTKYHLELDEKINWETISSEIKMNLYRIIQEAVHNCNKYAQATLMQINLIQQKSQLSLTIQDNGIGFDVNEAKQGIGLHNMSQRILSINGTINIHSTPEIGTIISCTVAIKH
ncbi:tetratricopeptide repeat-containing sensor histidine kinase [Flavobacterium sp.]|uniref:tetratricopeptide repeat-containing sensor histidine kinase n=1 Tax=Flavobacterium sp. TaxID=239 RepID=UPI002B4B0DDF|nr:tetratricopeptide repeat protein [Flavobacterium sp.]HLP63413.1 tetratricopeptide repeat protein [Flavobacterium sp.]